jgi:hypothetical protein
MWPEGKDNPSGNDNTNNNTYMFRPSQEGIDLNKWNVHLGVKNRGSATIQFNSTLDGCADYAKEEDIPTFVYNFEVGKCFPKEEGTLSPRFPWGPGNYYPGALFVSKQSTYDFVSTEGTTCEDVGMVDVTTSAACKAAAQELGLSSVEPETRDSMDFPHGCYWNTRTGGGLNIARNGTTGTQIKYSNAEGESGLSRLQICKRI